MNQDQPPRTTGGLHDFLRESLAIEGIFRDPTPEEMAATDRFLEGALTVDAVIALQAVYAPGKPLRDRLGMNVRVGRYLPPSGDPDMRAMLEGVIRFGPSPWDSHVLFEKLHPFMDGNGRTGRAVWAWMMLRSGEDPFALSFLHRFYYQTLEHAA